MNGCIYCRISDDTEGLEHGVENQQADCEAFATKEGIPIVEVFVDNDMGASTRSKTKVRPGYAAMVQAIEAGRIDCIVAYSNSRLTRRPMEYESLIQLHERTGVRIKTVVSGEDDLATADGRMVARIKASIDAGEAERTAERVTRSHKGRAERGIPVGGPRPFGWNADRRTLDPVESAFVLEAIDLMLGGTPFKLVLKDWNARGVLTTRGNEWTRQSLRPYFQNPRLVGWRVYQGKNNVLTGPDGSPVAGQWEPMIDEPTWHRLQAVMASQREVRVRVPRRDHRHYLLTGILRCGRCSAFMYGNRAGSENYFYTCRLQKDHTNTVSGPSADAAVERLMETMLQDNDVKADATPREWPGQPGLDELRQRASELMGAFTAGQLSGGIVFPQVQALEAQIQAAEAERGQWSAETTGPVLSEATVHDWHGSGTDAKRALIEKALSAVLVKPVIRRGGRVFDAERLVPVPRESRTFPLVAAG